MELTILMPCLNEAETLERCIKKANSFLATSGVKGEVVIADNGSTDGSQDIARRNNARVVDVPAKGYGAALAGGIRAAHGQYIIMGDSDDSYDFSSLMPFIEKLREGYQLVMGNRFKGGIARGAMPFLHKYLGNPVLTFIGRLLFKSSCGDFHCGLRGFNKEAIQGLNLRTNGMEFASEMIVKSALYHLRIIEVPTTLSKDGRSRPPHLRTWRDGWRHLRFLLMYSPRWLFFYPGLFFITLGTALIGLLLPGPLKIGTVELDVHTMLLAGTATILGTQIVIFAVLAKQYASNHGLLPRNARWNSIMEFISLERMLIFSIVILVMGIVGIVLAVTQWGAARFGHLNYENVMRYIIPSVTLIVTGLQIFFGAFLSGILNLSLSDQSQSPPVSD